MERARIAGARFAAFPILPAARNSTRVQPLEQKSTHTRQDDAQALLHFVAQRIPRKERRP